MLAAALLVSLGWVAPAIACPNCAVGRQARSEVWNEDFGFNLFVALLLFLVIGGVCVRVEASGRLASGSQPSDQPVC